MRLVIVIISILCFTTLKAEVMLESHQLIITGEIKRGDSEVFLQRLKSALTSGYISHNSLQNVKLRDLSGGSVQEAIKISNLIDSLHMSTHIDGHCFSACALIYLSGSQRSYDSVAKLGVHSISFANESLGKLSLNEAKQIYTTNLTLFLSELSKHGGPQEMIEAIKNTASSEIADLQLSSIPIFKDFVREWASDRCGSISSKSLSSGQLMERVINHYIVKGGDGAYDRLLQKAVQSGNPQQWFEDLGKTIDPEFSYASYQEKTKCYNESLKSEFRESYLNFCSKNKLDCDDAVEKLLKSTRKKAQVEDKMTSN